LEPIKVIICDDHVLYRAGVKTALSAKKDIKIVAEADNGMHLLNLLKMIPPVDVVLLDIQMPIMDGIATLPELKKAYPGMKIIMLTMMNDDSMIVKLMEIGANSYLTKTSDSEIIYEAIKTCYNQEYYFNALTNKALLSALKPRDQSSAQIRQPSEVILNDKEIAILKLMCEEKSTKEIAYIVDLSPRTVEAIRDKLKQKTGAKSTTGLIMYAVKSGLINEDGWDEAELLNEEEKRILTLLKEEKSTSDIAQTAKVTESVVEAIRNRLFSKTGTKSTAGLVIHAVKHKLISENK
jgi:DNA-binding NarL/FixJ family response regulator